MKYLATRLRDIWLDRRAMTALEYGFLASIIFAIVFAGFMLMAQSLSNTFNTVGASL